MAIMLAALLGLLIGSFLNVCIYRLPRGLSVVRPRSFCPSCETTIRWYDNIPVVSYVWLGGRCRYCHAGIPWRYPAVELLTTASFAPVAWRYGASVATVKGCVFSALLIGLVFSDLEQLILPDELTLGGLLAGLAFALADPMDSFFARALLPAQWGARLFSLAEALLAVVVTAGSLWLVGELYYRVRKREGLGFGDVKMVAMIGSFLGLQGALTALVFGSVLGSVVGLLLVVLKRKDAATYELPFGSFLGFAALITGVWAPALASWPRGSM